MHTELTRGSTVLLSGPASITLLKGKVTVLGKELIIGEKIIVRKGKAIPFESIENSIMDVILGVDASVTHVSGSTIPNSWKKAVEQILPQAKPCSVLVLGEVDSGKTTFSTFLINKALSIEIKPAIIDLDLGQSDIGPPTTIGVGLIIKPLTDLFSLMPFSVIFTGRLSPNGITDRILQGLHFIRTTISESGVGLLIVNTDGWVEGKAAYSYKSELIHDVSPDYIVGIQQREELEPILHPSEEAGFNVLRLSPSSNITKRDKAARRELRNQNYKKYLKDLTLRNLPISWLQFEYTPFGLGTSLDITSLRNLEKELGYRVVYCEDSSKELFMVVDKHADLEAINVKLTEKFHPKKVYVVTEGDEKGILVGLLNKDRVFLGLGILSQIDYKNRVLKVLTHCKSKIGVVQFSQIKINEDGKEIGISEFLFKDS